MMKLEVRISSLQAVVKDRVARDKGQSKDNDRACSGWKEIVVL